MRCLWPLALAALVPACATETAPPPRAQEPDAALALAYEPEKAAPQLVEVPVPLRCTARVPQRPHWPLDDPALSSKDLYTKGMAALAEIEQRRAYEARLEAALRACVYGPQ
jgi:hypothetical protein